MGDRIRIGIIGAGGISRGHINAFRAVADTEVTALAEPSADMRQKAKEFVNDANWTPAEYDDHETMLKNESLDAVLIASPHTLHHEQALAALESGCHLMMEKPMVCRASHAKEMMRKAEKLGRKILVSYQRHYSPLYIGARQMIESGVLGKLTAVCGYLSQRYYHITGHTWRGDPDLAGEMGQFNDSGSHLVAAMFWCSGLRAQQVFCYGENGTSRVNLNSSTAIHFNDRCLGTLSINGYVSDPFSEELIFWGIDGSLHIKNGHLYHGKTGHHPEPVENLPGERNRHEEFVAAIRGDGPITSDAEIGLRVAELTEAASTSVKTGSPCEVASL